MGHYDEQGNWIEEFRSQTYESEAQARNKINAVINSYVHEAGWVLNGTPRVEMIGNKYVAVIPLKKLAEQKKSRPR